MSLLDLLFPSKCPFCHRLLEKEESLFCARCQQALPWFPGPAGQQEPEFLTGCVSALFYLDTVREGVHRFKFQNRPGYAGAFGMLMAQAVQDAWPDICFDAVTWVPLSRRRRRSRGYDQSELLCREVARRLALPVCPALVKHRHTPPQSLRSDAAARRANALGAYRISETSVAGKTLLLCDDVVTSGATLSECARVLLTAGAAEVYAVTLARGKN